MDRADLRARLAALDDHALLFHGFTNYMRDYELVVYELGDRRAGIIPRHLRFLFRVCTEAEVRSRVEPSIWSRSLGDGLLAMDRATSGAPGYVWGVRWQELYPGPTIVEDSERARKWSEEVGVPFHEVQIGANAHVITLVFSELLVDEVTAGYSPFEVTDRGSAEQDADRINHPL